MKTKSTREMKHFVKKEIQENNIPYRKISLLYYIVPFLIVCVVMSIIEAFTIISSGQSSIKYLSLPLSILLSVVGGLVSGVLYFNSANFIKNRVPDSGFKAPIKVLSIAILIPFLTSLLEFIKNALPHVFISGSLTTFFGLLVSILIFILSVISPAIIYVAASRSYSLSQSITLGIKIGFKNFFKLLWIGISFIPLIILIIFTAFILGIWKLYYIELVYAHFIEEFLEKEGL